MYGTLAEVYDFLVPEPLLSPEGSAAVFDEVLAGLEPGARVLDCACGTGTLAVGLALRGLEVTASDASPEMVARTQALRTALDGMRRVSRDGALLVITSRNWERPQAGGDETVERDGRRAAVRRVWHDGEPPRLEIDVALDDGSSYGEELSYWPFTHAELDEDLRAAGFEPETSTWTADAERYAVTSRAKASNASR